MKLLLLAVLSFILTACGGGGGGGGGGATGDKQIDEPLKLRAYPAVNYSGNEMDATLTQSSFPRYIANFYNITQLVVSFTVDVFEYNEPYFLSVAWSGDVASSDDSNEDLCSSGRFAVYDETNEETGLGRVVIQYTNCVVDDIKFDGQVVYNITSWYPQTNMITASINQLEVVFDNEKIILQGDFELEHPNVLTSYALRGQAIMSSVQQNRLIKLDNVVINSNSSDASVQAEMWDSVDGKVTISSKMDENPLTFTGGNGTQGTLDFDFDNTKYRNPISSFNLKLANLQLSQFDLVGEFDPESILEWPETVNQRPHVVDAAPISVDRNATLSLNVAHYISDQDDLLIYAYRVISAPSGCGHQILPQDVQTVELVFPCQGDYVLEITANDGTTDSVVLPLTINVIPLPAEFENFETVDVEKGSQFDVALNITNEAQDGPFDFAIGHAPKGVTITQQGVISGVPDLLLYENNSSINIKAVADNGRKSSVQFNVNVRDPSVELNITPFHHECENERWDFIGQNNSVGYFCKWGNSYVRYELNAGMHAESHVGRNFSDTSRLLFLGLQEFNGDGSPELILVYEDSIYVVKPVLDEVISVIPLSRFSGLANFDGVKVHPATGVMNGFILQAKTRFFLYSMVSDTVVSTFETGTALVRVVGNIDSDAEPEFLMDDGRLYGFGSAVRNLELLVGNKATFIANVTGTAADEIIVVEGNDECPFPSYVQLSVYDASNLERISQSSIPNPLGAQVPWCPNMKFVQAHGNSYADLYFLQPFEIPLYRYVYSNDAFEMVRTFEYGDHMQGGSLWGLTIVGKHLVVRRDDAIHLVDIDTGDIGEFAFTLKNQLIENFGPAWNGSRILANYTINNSLINPLIYAEFDGADDVELKTIDPALNLYAKDVLDPQHYQTMDSALVGVSRNEIDASASLYSVPAGHLIGTFAGNRNTFSGDRWTISDFNGDQEYDAFTCGLAGETSALAWLQMNSNTPVWQVNISQYGVKAGCVGVALIGHTFGEDQRLAALFRYEFGGALLVIYDYSQGGIVEVARYPIESVGHYTYSIAVLDVTGDETDEVVVYRDAATQNSPVLSRFWVVSAEADSVQTFDVEMSKPVIQKNRPAGNKNLLIAGSYGKLRESPYNARKLFSRLYEVSATDGAIVWQSNSFVGSMTEYGYYNLDQARVGEKVMIVTSKGLHFYH